MAIVLVKGKKYDFCEPTLEDSLAVGEMLPAYVAAMTTGKAIPLGTTIAIADVLFKHCLVDGKEIGDIRDYFKGTKMLTEFKDALAAGIKANYSDFFMELIASLPESSAKKTIVKAFTAE